MSRQPGTGPGFGEILESFRRRRGLKRRQIGRQLGVNQGQIKDWEQGVEIPMHPGLLGSLEVILEIPEGLLSRAAGFSAPAQVEPRMTISQSLATLSRPEVAPPVHPLDSLPEGPRERPSWMGSAGSREGSSGIVSYRYNLLEERWVYRMRFLLTGAGMALLGLLLMWALGRVWEELGSVWNAVFGS